MGDRAGAGGSGGRVAHAGAFERHAHAQNFELGCHAEERVHHGGMRVGVLVRVEVRRSDAGGDDALDLGAKFALDFGFDDQAAPEAAGEIEEVVRELAVFPRERGNFRWRRYGFAADQDQMAADINIRMIGASGLRHRRTPDRWP